MDTEVYTNAPLAMVVAEVQFAYTPELDEQRLLASVVQTAFPGEQPSLALKPMINVETPEANRQIGLVVEAVTSDRQRTASLSPQAMSVAMSGQAYRRYQESLRQLINRACAGLLSAQPSILVTRLGLRYLDEIRPPVRPEQVQDWERWVDPALVGPSRYLTGVGGRAVSSRSTWNFELEGGRGLAFNFGPFEGSGIVSADHPFHQAGANSLMFVLDVDVSWTPPGGHPIQLSRDEILTHYDGLHRPAQEIFAAVISEESKKLFRGEL